MPFGGYLGRRLGFRTRRYGGAKRRARKVATVQAVKRMIDGSNEKKFINVGNALVSATLANATPVITLLNGLSQGVTDNTRVGDRVRCKNLEYTFLIYSAAGISQTINYELIRVKEPRGVAPTYLQIYNSATPNVDDHHNRVNVDWPSRFMSIAKGSVHLESNYAAQVATKKVDLNISFEDAVSDYSINTLGSIADIDKNAYYMLYWTDSASAASVYHAYYLFYMDM